MGKEGRTNHCIQALPSEDRTSPLYDPKAFTPVELRRMVRCQIKSGREVHVLAQKDNGVLEITIDFRDVKLSEHDIASSARATEELMEISQGFFFQVPVKK